MIVIDANTGLVVEEGMEFTNVDGHMKMVKIYPGIFSAHAIMIVNGVRKDVGLQVRWTHPHYFLQHVAFIPS
jgi:hypothetical protein